MYRVTAVKSEIGSLPTLVSFPSCAGTTEFYSLENAMEKAKYFHEMCIAASCIKNDEKLEELNKSYFGGWKSGISWAEDCEFFVDWVGDAPCPNEALLPKTKVAEITSHLKALNWIAKQLLPSWKFKGRTREYLFCTADQRRIIRDCTVSANGGIKLSSYTYRNLDLSYMNFSSGSLDRVTFEDCNLNDVRVDYADCSYVELRRCTFAELSFRRAKFSQFLRIRDCEGAYDCRPAVILENAVIPDFSVLPFGNMSMYLGGAIIGSGYKLAKTSKIKQVCLGDNHAPVSVIQCADGSWLARRNTNTFKPIDEVIQSLPDDQRGMYTIVLQAIMSVA